MTWTLGDEFKQERVLELERLGDELGTLPHAPACPAGAGCWCPLHDVAALIVERVADLQADDGGSDE